MTPEERQLQLEAMIREGVENNIRNWQNGNDEYRPEDYHPHASQSGNSWPTSEEPESSGRIYCDLDSQSDESLGASPQPDPSVTPSMLNSVTPQGGPADRPHPRMDARTLNLHTRQIDRLDNNTRELTR